MGAVAWLEVVSGIFEGERIGFEGFLAMHCSLGGKACSVSSLAFLRAFGIHTHGIV